jgi:hypothetical protein
VSVWEIITSESYDVWFQEQTEGDKVVIRSKVYLLSEYGPNLKRPHADTLKGSKELANLKELRAKTDAHEFRIAYIFDPERKGLLLIGGDKKGKTQKKFYKDLISEAEQIYATYLEKRINKKEQ